MKKDFWISFWTVVVVFVLIFAVIVGVIVKERLTLSEFLDESQIVPGMGQGEFKELRGNYSYEGKNLGEMKGGIHYDGPYGGGWNFGGRYFAFFNDYDDRGGIAKYTNEIYVSVPLEGLELPCDLNFGDHVLTALAKIGLSFETFEDFKIGFTTSGDFVIYNSDGVRLSLSQDDTQYLYGKPWLKVVYSESSERTSAKGKVIQVKRYVEMIFYEETHCLAGIYFGVQERYLVD